MRSPRVMFIPVGRTTFDQVEAQAVYAASVRALQAAGLTITEPGRILISPEEAEAWCRQQGPETDWSMGFYEVLAQHAREQRLEAMAITRRG